MGRIGDARAVEPLIKALDDTRYSVRETVAEALGVLLDVRAIEPLQKAISDEEKWIGKPTAAALQRIQESLLPQKPLSTLTPTCSSPTPVGTAATPKPISSFEFSAEVAAIYEQMIGAPTADEIFEAVETANYQSAPNQDAINRVCKTLFSWALKNNIAKSELLREIVRSVGREVVRSLPSNGATTSNNTDLPTAPHTRDGEGYDWYWDKLIGGRRHQVPDTTYITNKWYNGK